MRSKQVLSRDEMKHLQKLGLDTSKASMCWLKDTEGEWHIFEHDEFCYEAAFMCPEPAFTLQDVLDQIPTKLDINGSIYEPTFYKLNGKWCADLYTQNGADIQTEPADDLIDAAYNRLLWLIENGYIEKGGNNEKS